MAGDEDDGNVDPCFGHPLCRSSPLSPGRRTSSTRQPGTSGACSGGTPEPRRMSRPEADRPNEILECFAHATIVIDDEYHGVCFGHDVFSPPVGNVN